MAGHTINFSEEEMKKIRIFKAVHDCKSIPEAVKEMINLGYDRNSIKRKIDKV